MSAPQYITIAISGCSSSGKSTLALLLQEILSTAPRSGPIPCVTLNDSTTNLSLTSSDKENHEPKPEAEHVLVNRGRAIVAHQDAFFLDKSHCPNVTFRTTLNDLNFVEQSLLNDTIGTYTMTRPESSNPDDSPTKAVTLNYKVTGADTDCWQAIDAPSMVSCIKQLRESGSVTSLCERYQIQDKMLPGLLISKEETNKILTSHEELIKEMKEVVREWVHDQSVANLEAQFSGLNITGALAGKDALPPKFLIIEGFLLFPDPNLHGPKEKEKEQPRSLGRPKSSHFKTPQNDLAPLSTCPIPEEGGEINEHTAYIDAYERLNAIARSTLMDNFDIKLFLPTSNSAARTRRFRRNLYNDAPEGKRYPGQMWKTEGYFDDVCWANYIRECGWLVERNGVETSRAGVAAGVHVRPQIDMGVEDTVRWAVDIVLGVLGNKVSAELVLGDSEEDYEDEEKMGFKCVAFCSFSPFSSPPPLLFYPSTNIYSTLGVSCSRSSALSIIPSKPASYASFPLNWPTNSAIIPPNLPNRTATSRSPAPTPTNHQCLLPNTPARIARLQRPSFVVTARSPLAHRHTRRSLIRNPHSLILDSRRFLVVIFRMVGCSAQRYLIVVELGNQRLDCVWRLVADGLV
jgi:hypothetical protein